MPVLRRHGRRERLPVLVKGPDSQSGGFPKGGETMRATGHGAASVDRHKANMPWLRCVRSSRPRIE